MNDAKHSLDGRDWGVIALLLLPFAWLAHRFWFVCDDAYISFRYARNWADGHGLRFNLGELPAVEGYSNFLWVLLGRIVHTVGARMDVVLPWVSALCGALLIAATYRVLRRHATPMPVAATATLGLALFPPFALWSSSGLETMPFALAIFATWERLFGHLGHRRALLAALAAVAASLLRIEGIAWGLGLGAFAVLADVTSKRSLSWTRLYFGVLLASFATYWLARWSYFDTWLPNTAMAKSSLSGASIARGFDYVVVFALTFLSPLCVVVVAALTLKGGRTRALILGLIGAVGYAVATGGDFMPMGRFLVPAFALGAVLWGVWGTTWWQRGPAGRRAFLGVSALVLILQLLPTWNVHAVPTSVRESFHFRGLAPVFRSETEQWSFMNDNAAYQERLGRALAVSTAPDDSVVYGAIGALGYFGDRTIYDVFGLVSPDVAQREVTELRSPGHDKGVAPEWFLDRSPTHLKMGLFEFEHRHEGAQRLARDWFTEPARSRYAPVMYPIPPEGTPTHVLMTLTRVDGDAMAVWRAFLRRLGVPDDQLPN